MSKNRLRQHQANAWALAEAEKPFNHFYWLVSLIRRLRPDLRKLFPLNKEDHGAKFVAWLMGSGVNEYKSLLEDQPFSRFLSLPIPGIGLTPLQALIYFQRADVQKAYPLPKCTHDVARWFDEHGRFEHKLSPLIDTMHSVRIAHDNTDDPARSVRPFGVNLIGYAYGQLGIGEDIRMTAKAMQAADIPFTIVNFPPGKDIPQNDYSMDEYVSESGPYAINIFCMTALETGRYYAEQGKAQFEDRYNIGYWPWELSKWPEEWMDLFCLVDEVWVSSKHTYDAVAPVSPVPVLIMPLAVELGSVSDLGRADFALPTTAYLFCFSFDLNSSIHRKNPQACVDAFLQAFPLSESNAKNRDEVGLVIKVHKPTQRHPEWDKLKQIAVKDDRIHIIEGTLSRPDLLALYKCCDCYLSLHRAEGFGRGIAEALLLGLRVIATGYSGNVDFCKTSRSMLTDYQLIPVHAAQYPFGKDQQWADANIDHVVLAMHQVAKQSDASQCDESHLKMFQPAFMGKFYAGRISYIQNTINCNLCKNGEIL